jgi:hypothetical protein
MTATKTACPITRDQFNTNAKGIVVTLPDGQKLLLDARQFSIGSLGWYANGKVTVDVGGVQVKCQVGFQLTVIGSKELPQQ